MTSSEGNITCEGNIAGKPDISEKLRCMWNALTEVTSDSNITTENNITG